MTREELRNDYGNEICELCCREYFVNRAFPETLCEGRYCEDEGGTVCWGYCKKHKFKHRKRGKYER